VPLQKREKITPDPVRLRKAHPATLAEVTVRLVTVTLDAEPCAAPLDLPAPRRAGRVTISAVARAAGVSTTTVSRFLNGGCVSSSLRARITRVVRDLEYTPSFSARSLQARRSGRIGVVHASHQSASFGQILAGIEERLASTGQSVLLANLAADGQGDANQDHGTPHEAAVADWIRQRRVDGIIFIGSTVRQQSLLSAAESAGLPVVLIAPRVPAPRHCSLRCDNVQGGRLIARHLLDCGHRRIAFVGAPGSATDTRDRLSGMYETLCRGRAELLLEDHPRAHAEDCAAGIEHARAFLVRGNERRVTAVVLASDSMALGFLRSVLEHGVHVPRDLSVAGFGGIPLGALYYPGLTTVAQPAQQMGSAACQVLFGRIEGKALDEVASLAREVLLIQRESTSVPPFIPFDRAAGKRQAGLPC
jgi:LacI family transcriptional regulator